MINSRAAIFANLQTIMFMMGNSTGNVRGEFERQVSSIGSLSTLDEHDRWLALSFQDHRLRDVALGRADERHVAVDDQELASVRARVQEHQVLLRHVLLGVVVLRGIIVAAVRALGVVRVVSGVALGSCSRVCSARCAVHRTAAAAATRAAWTAAAATARAAAAAAAVWRRSAVVRPVLVHVI